MIAVIEVENGSHGPDHAPFRCRLSPRLGFDAVYPYAKFDDSSFSHSTDIIGGVKKFKMGHVILTTHLLRVICHPHAGA